MALLCLTESEPRIALILTNYGSTDFGGINVVMLSKANRRSLRQNTYDVTPLGPSAHFIRNDMVPGKVGRARIISED